MDRVKNYLKRIYGFDALSCGCILMGVLINLATYILYLRGFNNAKNWNYLTWLPFLIVILRCFSVNYERRRAENDWFTGLLESLFSRKSKNDYGEIYRTGKSEEIHHEDRKQFKFFKCPACRQKIRVPRGKGRIEITCPRCGDRFIKKT